MGEKILDRETEKAQSLQKAVSSGMEGGACVAFLTPIRFRVPGTSLLAVHDGKFAVGFRETARLMNRRGGLRGRQPL
ncbi:MAG: hypothetical protein WCX84_04295, partial [Syntrophales bacterium]